MFKTPNVADSLARTIMDASVAQAGICSDRLKRGFWFMRLCLAMAEEEKLALFRKLAVTAIQHAALNLDKTAQSASLTPSGSYLSVSGRVLTLSGVQERPQAGLEGLLFPHAVQLNPTKRFWQRLVHRVCFWSS
jgi:hypothetical protein